MDQRKSAFELMQESAISTSGGLTTRQITARVAGIVFILLCIKSVFG